MREELHLSNELKTILKNIESYCQKEDFDKVELLFQDAFEICKKNNFQGAKAVFLCNKALVSVDRGNMEKAQELWEKAIDLFDEMGEIKNKASVLHNMATVIASQGNITLATDYWKRSLEIKEKIGDKTGMAATMLNLAWVANKNNDFLKEKELYLQAGKYLAENKVWNELIKVLISLSKLEKENKVNFLSNALWLSVHVETDADTLFFAVSELVKEIGLKNEFSPVIASSGLLLSERKNARSNPELQRALKEIVAACALVRNIENNKLSDWLEKEEINNSEKTFIKLKKVLDKLVSPENWFFERSLF